MPNFQNITIILPETYSPWLQVTTHTGPGHKCVREKMKSGENWKLKSGPTPEKCLEIKTCLEHLSPLYCGRDWQQNMLTLCSPGMHGAYHVVETDVLAIPSHSRAITPEECWMQGITNFLKSYHRQPTLTGLCIPHQNQTLYWFSHEGQGSQLYWDSSKILIK